MKKPLNVYFRKVKVGTLQKHSDDTLAFQYSRSWLDSSQSFALTPALPLQEEAFNNRLSKSYFDNLLPEGDTLKTFEALLKKSFEDPYQLLESYGLDCAGALEITPSEEPPENHLTGDADPLSFDEIDKVIEQRGSLYVHTLTRHKGRFSLAGAQDKIPVLVKGDRVFIPQDASPTTHILKPPTRIPGIFESVYNEYLCMKMALLIGLPTPEVKIVGHEHPLFLIARYDREGEQGRVKRVHQFDLCQAQGFPAAEKYEDDGGPSFSQNYLTIQQISERKIHDLDLALRWLCFNLIIGNNDSHSKNLSFVLKEQGTELAPLYDLMSTGLYEGMTSKFAFAVGGQREWHQLKKTHFKKLARQLGYEKREDLVFESMTKECEKMTALALPFLEEFIRERPSSLIARKLRDEIEKRTRVFQKLS